MVVPIEKVPKNDISTKTKKYVGNNLNLRLSTTAEDCSSFVVIGNNCSVKLRDGNFASLQVVGDNCRISVPASDTALITYVGNNGKIRASGVFSETNITYIGSCGMFSNNANGIYSKLDNNNNNNNNNNSKSGRCVNNIVVHNSSKSGGGGSSSGSGGVGVVDLVKVQDCQLDFVDLARICKGNYLLHRGGIKMKLENKSQRK